MAENAWPLPYTFKRQPMDSSLYFLFDQLHDIRNCEHSLQVQIKRAMANFGRYSTLQQERVNNIQQLRSL